MKKHILKFTYMSSKPEVGSAWCGRHMAVGMKLAVNPSRITTKFCSSCKRSYYKWRKDEKIKKVRKKLVKRRDAHDRV